MDGWERCEEGKEQRGEESQQESRVVKRRRVKEEEIEWREYGRVDKRKKN